MPIEKEEYELIPVSPLRRLEKRIEQIESSPAVDVREIIHEIVDIVRMNQQLVDELAKANDSLRIELSKIPGRLEELSNSLNELLSYIKASATEEITTGVATESFKPLIEKFDELIEANKKIIENNDNMASLLEDISKKLRPTLPFRKLPPPPLQRPQLTK
ncbi:MAG: hypothetical protein QXO27_03870 [Candidatus Aenigmatarchaeota archaeon]